MVKFQKKITLFFSTSRGGGGQTQKWKFPLLFFFEPFPYFYAHNYQLFLPRMLDDDMRSMMAIDWMSREQEIPGTIDKEMRNTLEELEMSRRSGRELRLKIFYSLSILSYSQEVAFYLHLGKIFWLNICHKSSVSFYP